MIKNTIFLILAIASISIAADNSIMYQNNRSDWISVVIGVVIPALLLFIFGAVIYARLKSKMRKKEEIKHVPSEGEVVEHGLRATPALQKYEQDLSVPDEEIWEIDELDSSLEEIVLNALKNATQLREDNRIREYFVAISKIIRQYVGAIFDIEAGESRKIADATTGEILESLPQNLTESTVDHVGEILRICDMVKFAQYKPSNADLDQIDQLAVEFIENQIDEIADDSEDFEQDELEDFLKRANPVERF